MKIPGAVWTMALTVLPLMAVWLDTYFQGAIWAAPIGGLLLIAAKAIEAWPKSAQPLSAAGVDFSAPAEKPVSTARRFWMG